MQKILFGLGILLATSAQASILGLSNPADTAENQGTGAYIKGHYFAGDDYIAVSQFSGNWNTAFTPRSGTNLALLSARMETGVVKDSWRIAALYREDVLIESSRDLTDALYYNKQHISVPAGQNFNLQLKAESLAADGFKVEKGFTMPLGNRIVPVGLGVSLLHGISTRMGSVSGTASSTSTGYNYNATVEDAYSHDSYPFIRPAQPSGIGYALDIGTRFTFNDNSELDLAVNDLLGEMRWDNMPHTIDVANSATLVRDPSGYIYYNPLITGQNDLNRRTIVQHLDPKLDAQYVKPLGNFDAQLRLEGLKGYWLPEVGAACRWNANWKSALDYDARFKTVGLSVEHRFGYLKLRSNSTSLSAARAYGISGGINVPF